MTPSLRLVGGIGRLGQRARPSDPDAVAPTLAAGNVITLRVVQQDADGELERLAQLSGVERPSGPSLVAEVNGEARAALPLAGGTVLADPFHPSTELGSLLTLRLAQLDASPPDCA